METRLDQTERKLEQERTQRQSLEDELHRLHTKQESHDREYNEAKRSIEEVKSSCTEIRNRYESRIEDVADRKDIGGIERRLQGVENLSKNNEGQINVIHSQVLSTDSTVGQLKRTVDETNDKLSEQSNEMLKIKNSMDSLQRSVGDTQTLVNSGEQKITSVQRQMDTTENNIKQTYNSLHEEVEAVERGIKRVEKSLAEKTDRVEASTVSQQECSRLVEEKLNNYAFGNTMTQLEQKLANVTEDMERSSSELYRWKELDKERSSEISHLKNSISHIEEEMQSMDSKQKVTEKALRDETESLKLEFHKISQETHSSITKTQENMNNLGERMNQRNNETNDRLQRQSKIIHDISDKLQEMNVYIDEATKRFVRKDEHQEYVAIVDKLFSSSTDNSSSIEQLRERCSSLESYLQTTNDSVDSVGNRVRDFQREWNDWANGIVDELQSLMGISEEYKSSVESLFSGDSILEHVKEDVASLKQRLGTVESVAQNSVDGSRQLAETCMQYIDNVSENVTSTMKRMEKRVIRLINSPESEQPVCLQAFKTKQTATKEDILEDPDFLQKISDNVSSFLQRRQQQQMKQLGEALRGKLKSSLENSVNVIGEAESKRISEMEEQILRIRDTVVSLRALLQNDQRNNAAMKVHMAEPSYPLPERPTTEVAHQGQVHQQDMSPPRCMNPSTHICYNCPAQSVGTELQKQPACSVHVNPIEEGTHQKNKARLPQRKSVHTRKKTHSSKRT